MLWLFIIVVAVGIVLVAIGALLPPPPLTPRIGGGLEPVRAMVLSGFILIGLGAGGVASVLRVRNGWWWW